MPRLTLTEAAQEVGCKASTLRKLIADGAIPSAAKIGPIWTVQVQEGKIPGIMGKRGSKSSILTPVDGERAKP